MRKPVVINAEPERYSPRARSILNDVAELRELPLGRAALLAALPDADGLIVRLGHRVDDELLAAGPRLRFVATATTGLNHIDLKAAGRRGIAVLSLKGETEFLDTVTATAEHTWGLLLALIRHLPAAAAQASRGHWNRNYLVGRQLSGLTLSIVGYGRLGRIVAGYARAFRMRILAVDPHPLSRDEGIGYVSLNDALKEADVLSIHVALTPETERLLGSSEFSSMKPGSYLVNSSRGEVLDEGALLFALQSGRLAGAALDVLCNEVPCGARWRSDHPLLTYARAHDNLLITPHIGGATRDSMHQTEEFLAQKIRRFWEEQI